MSHGTGDHGPKPYAVDIEKATVDNDAFRDTLWTGEHLQLTVMTIPAGGEIGAEIHDDHDQFLRLEAGSLRAMIGTSETELELDETVHDDFAIFDTFPGDAGRLAHLAGKVGRALVAKTPELLDGLPKIEDAQVLAYKLTDQSGEVRD